MHNNMDGGDSSVDRSWYQQSTPQNAWEEEQCPAEPTDKCRPEATRPTSNIPGWLCLGSDTNVATSPSLTDWGSGKYGLQNNTLWDIRSSQGHDQICRELVSNTCLRGYMKNTNARSGCNAHNRLLVMRSTRILRALINITIQTALFVTPSKVFFYWIS